MNAYQRLAAKEQAIRAVWQRHYDHVHEQQRLAEAEVRRIEANYQRGEMRANLTLEAA